MLSVGPGSGVCDIGKIEATGFCSQASINKFASCVKTPMRLSEILSEQRALRLKRDNVNFRSKK
jgi:hypothetical protein